MRTRDLSNLQVFALSLPRGFIIIPDRVSPTHLWKKDRHVIVWVSKGCCLSRERLRDPTAPANHPTPLLQSSYPLGEGEGGPFLGTVCPCSVAGPPPPAKGVSSWCNYKPGLRRRSGRHSVEGKARDPALTRCRHEGRLESRATGGLLQCDSASHCPSASPNFLISKSRS